jgi:hypothetical protein
VTIKLYVKLKFTSFGYKSPKAPTFTINKALFRFSKSSPHPPSQDCATYMYYTVTQQTSTSYCDDELHEWTITAIGPHGPHVYFFIYPSLTTIYPSRTLASRTCSTPSNGLHAALRAQLTGSSPGAQLTLGLAPAPAPHTNPF